MAPICRCAPRFSRRHVLAGALAQPALLAWPISKALPQTNIMTLRVATSADQAINSLMPTTPDVARAMASRGVSSCESIAQQDYITIKEIAASDRAVAEGERKLASLQERKRLVLEQLRQGYYCSQCTRSKIEIEEQEHISFEQHLIKVNGHPVPAPQDVILKKMAELNAPIDAESKEQTLRREHRDKLKAFNENLQQQFGAGVLLWKTAILAEYGLLESQFKKKDALEVKMLEEAKASLDSLKQEEPRIMQGVNANDAMALARLQRNQDAQALQAERIEIITKSIAARKRNYDDSVKALTSNRDWEAKRLTDAARSMTGNGPSQMMTIPNVSVTFSGWDIGISDTQAGVKFKFNGVLSAGLTSTFDRDGHSAETLARPSPL